MGLALKNRWVALTLCLCSLMLGLGQSSVRFAVAQTATPSATATPGTPSRPLKIGVSMDGTLTDPNKPDRYAIFGAYGDLISVGMFPAQTGQLIPAFDVYAPDGSLVASVVGKSEALLSAFRLPSTGAYIIYAKPGTPTGFGAYTISVGSGWILRDLDGNPLRMGSPYSGALLRLGDRQVWQIDLRAGTTFNVAAQPSAGSPLDPVIEVIMPGGEQLAVAHDLNAANSATTTILSAPTSGTYLIRISAYVNKSVGAYDLIVRAPPSTPTPALNITAEPLDEKITASVGQGAQYSHIFRGIPGQTVTIEVHAQPPGSFDPLVELYGPSGRRVAEADDMSADNADALLKTTLNDGVGGYTIRVAGYALLPGTFILIVRSP